MGATLSCVQLTGTIRVLKADGEVLEFKAPVAAKQLMKLHPGHLVVHCTYVNKAGLGRRSKISMLPADHLLSVGQTYCLLRVPTQVSKGLFKPSSKGILVANQKTGANLRKEIQDQSQQTKALSVPVTSDQGCGWRPNLDAIPESPMTSLSSISSPMISVTRHHMPMPLPMPSATVQARG